MVVSEGAAAGTTALRVLSVVLLLELLWLLLVASSLLFLAAHLGGGPDELTDVVSGRTLLLSVPPVTLLTGLALLGARQAVEHRAALPTGPLSGTSRLALWGAALANAVVVGSIAISLYHARTTWLLVGLALAAALTAVAGACVRTART